MCSGKRESGIIIYTRIGGNMFAEAHEAGAPAPVQHQHLRHTFFNQCNHMQAHEQMAVTSLQARDHF